MLPEQGKQVGSSEKKTSVAGRIRGGICNSGECPGIQRPDGADGTVHAAHGTLPGVPGYTRRH